MRAIFVTPGLAVARLGGSTTPQHAFDWVDSAEPRFDAETTIAPAWTLAVQTNGSVAPFKPTAVTFRDGALIRPVAPFFEIWARLGEPDAAPETWQDVPLTPTLLQSNGTSLTALQLSVVARNLKAARRTGNPQLAFGNWLPITILGNEHTRVPIEGTSPPNAPVPMVPRDRNIPLGFVQMLHSTPQPADQLWSNAVNVETIRFRFTPGTGQFYGPPDAATARPDLERPEPAVPLANAFLNGQAGWRNASTTQFVQPGDTYDVIDEGGDARGASLGVVDDTCEVHFTITLQLGGGGPALSARAVAFVAPPDFAPDRRPFLSIADELNDRDGDASRRNAELTGDALDRWVEDLFERIYETVSLFNVDHYRAERAAAVPPALLNAADLDSAMRNAPERAMGGRDALRNPLYRLPRSTPNNDPLPLSQHARMRHRALADLQNLIALIALEPGRDRLREIIRGPFEAEVFENGNESSMRMPPFMRQSNALPLTLAAWQYELLMRWADTTRVRTSGMVAPAVGLAPAGRVMSRSAAARRSAVLAQIAAAERNR